MPCELQSAAFLLRRHGSRRIAQEPGSCPSEKQPLLTRGKLLNLEDPPRISIQPSHSIYSPFAHNKGRPTPDTQPPSSGVASLRQNEGSSEQFQGSFSIGSGKLRVPTTQAPHYFGVACTFYVGAPLSGREASPSKRHRSPNYLEGIPTRISASPQNKGSFPQILPPLSNRNSELRVPDGQILPKTAGLRAVSA